MDAQAAAHLLIEALRDGIARLGEHPLATALATATIGGTSAHAVAPPGFHPAQADSYRACLGEGIQLVWGSPGTGKTTVLKRAIGDLIAQGQRVLLVSATNIAVDNALLGVVREKRHEFGDIVRVGPPHLREVAEDPSVSLPLMVRARLTEAAAWRAELEAELVSIRDRSQQSRVGKQTCGVRRPVVLRGAEAHTVARTGRGGDASPGDRGERAAQSSGPTPAPPRRGHRDSTSTPEGRRGSEGPTARSRRPLRGDHPCAGRGGEQRGRRPTRGRLPPLPGAEAEGA
ncbi:AAA domain-containing protein [Streptomyces sp. NPDC018031]|uniref:AAA domain-containing protein n=1 Tax=Streptomyces sp. NPDC018031 TaxID=3365033 RepID=UPI00379FC09D